MSNLICELDALDALVTLETNKMIILGLTGGRWKNQTDKNMSRKTMQSKLVRAGAAKMNGKNLHISPDMSQKEANVNFITDTIDAIEALGFDIDFINFPAYVKMTVAEYEDDIPSYMPNDTIDTFTVPELDEFGNPIGEPEFIAAVPRKWSEWKDDNHSHVLFESEMYIPTNSMNSAHDLAGTILRDLKLTHTVKNMTSYPAGE